MSEKDYPPLDDLIEALRRIKLKAVSLADAQVIALEALSSAPTPTHPENTRPLSDVIAEWEADPQRHALLIAAREQLQRAQPETQPSEPQPEEAVFRHYKGGLYRVVALSNLEATGQTMVTYCSQADSRMWTRPMTEWREKFTQVSGPQWEATAFASAPQPVAQRWAGEWVSVPRKPTHEMMSAGRDMLPQGQRFAHIAYDCYCAMLAAAPQPPAAQPEREPMVSVTKADANNYCQILTILGMEEEGDPVAEVRRLLDEWQNTRDRIREHAAPPLEPGQAALQATYVSNDGIELPERRKRDRSQDDARIAHLFSGFDNIIDNASGYQRGYMQAMRKEFGELVATPEQGQAALPGMWSFEEAGVVARKAGFAGNSWVMGPEELAHLLNMLRIGNSAQEQAVLREAALKIKAAAQEACQEEILQGVASQSPSYKPERFDVKGKWERFERLVDAALATPAQASQTAEPKT